MTKKIIHFQIPIEQNKPYRDALAISPETLGKFLSILRTSLDREEWEIIASPFIPSVSEDGKTFFNFELGQLSKEELFNLIKEK